MQYRTYGNTGIRVSALGFGAMRLPVLANGKVDLDRGVPILRRGIDLGINYLDSAYDYINGTCDVVIGQAIKAYPREQVHVATKIPVDDANQARPSEWRRKLDELLRRLDTPYIDFIQFHGLEWPVFENLIAPAGKTLDEARKAQSEGLVRHICFSSHDTVENITKLIDTGEFAGMLVQYNYLDRHNEPVIAHAAAKEMGVIIMGPVAGGRLVAPGGVVIDGVEQEISAPELALRFVWNNPHVTLALSGMQDIRMVEENCATADRIERMDAREAERIQALLERNQKLADLYCTGCAYCMPCPNGVNIPENFRYMNWYRVWGLEKEARTGYASLSEAGVWMPYGQVSGLKADACLQCGECEPSCPQNIHIMDQLEEVARVLG